MRLLKTHEVLPSGLRVDRLWWYGVKTFLTFIALALIGAGIWAMLF